MAADDVELVELARAVALSDRLRVLLQPARRSDADPVALLRRRLLVHLVLGELGVDLAHDDAVVLPRPLDRDVAVGDVLPDRGRVALERVAEAAAAGGGAGEVVAGDAGHVREHRPEEASSSPSRVSQTPCGIDGSPPSMPQVIERARSHM